MDVAIVGARFFRCVLRVLNLLSVLSVLNVLDVFVFWLCSGCGPVVIYVVALREGATHSSRCRRRRRHQHAPLLNRP